MVRFDCLYIFELYEQQNMTAEIELTLKSKKRKVRIIGVLWTIVAGLIFYFVYGFARTGGVPSYELTLVVVFLSTVVVLAVTGIALKSPFLIWHNFWIFPFGILIPIGLNWMTPRWIYSQDGVGFGIGFWFLLLVVYFSACFLSTPIVRLCTGYDVTPQFQGKTYSYVFPCQISQVQSRLEELLSHFDISLDAYSVNKDQLVFGFIKEPNRFLVYCQGKDKDLIEVDFVPYAMSEDTLVEPINGKVETFLAAIDGIFRKWKEDMRLEVTSDHNPKWVNQAKRQLMTKYTTPIKFGITFSRTKSYLTKMTAIPRTYPHAFEIGLVLLGAIVGAIATKLLSP